MGTKSYIIRCVNGRYKKVEEIEKKVLTRERRRGILSKLSGMTGQPHEKPERARKKFLTNGFECGTIKKLLVIQHGPKVKKTLKKSS